MESPHLTYHLEGLADLLLKTEDGKYALSPLGKTAVSMMKQTEEPQNVSLLSVSFSPKKWKLLVAALTIGIIVLSAAFFLEYQSLRAPSDERSSLVDKYIVSSSVETALAKNETSQLNYLNYTCTSIMAPQGHTRLYSFRSLADNSTLEIEIQISDSAEEGSGISLAVYAHTIHPAVAYIGTIDKNTEPWGLTASQRIVEWAHSYDKIWQGVAINHSKYSISLPSDGQYFVLIEGPAEYNVNDYRTIGYTMTLQIQYQEDYVPFMIENEQESLYPFPF